VDEDTNSLNFQKLLADNAQDANELVDSVVTFLTNPAEQQEAHDQYRQLRMNDRTMFWDFYQKFRILASTGGITDDYTLRTADLPNKH